jgi:hypothetical protein
MSGSVQAVGLPSKGNEDDEEEEEEDNGKTMHFTRGSYGTTWHREDKKPKRRKNAQTAHNKWKLNFRFAS